MTYRLDAERFSSSALSRVKFIRRSERHSVEAAVVEDTLTMNEQTDDNSVCHSYIAHITVRALVVRHHRRHHHLCPVPRSPPIDNI